MELCTSYYFFWRITAMSWRQLSHVHFVIVGHIASGSIRRYCIYRYVTDSVFSRYRTVQYHHVLYSVSGQFLQLATRD